MSLPDRGTAGDTLLRSIGRRSLGAKLGLLAVAAGAVHAQTVEAPPEVPPEAPIARTFSIVPSLTVTETLTDNSRLVSSGKQADLVTQVTPSLRLTSNGGRFKGLVDYSLSGLLFARNSSSSEVQNSLNAVGNLEAVENWAYLDASANISQQSASAFGTQSPSSASVNGNRTEVRALTLSPYLRGRLAGSVDYEARLSRTNTDSSADTGSDNSSTTGSLKLDGESKLTVLSWSADATRQSIDYKAGRKTEDDRARGLLHYAATPELRLTGIVGKESNDYVSIDKQSRTTTGWGLDWNPSERTHLSAQREQRFFGASHAFSFQHRRASSVWSYTDTRDIRTDFSQPTAGSLGTVFDQFFNQLASKVPDPAQRAIAVNQFLQANGIPANTPVFGGSLASAATLERRQELSVAWLGLRDTVSLTAQRTEARRLDAVVSITDDFSNGNLVRQSGLSAVLAHRLTPQSALDLSFTTNRTTGTVDFETTTLRSVTLGWTGQIGPNTRAGLAARRAKFDSSISPYTESAVIASLSLQF